MRRRNQGAATSLLISLLGVTLIQPPVHAQDCDPAEVQRLLPSDAEAYDRIGFGLAVRGDTAIIGAIGAEEGAGAAYVYRDAGGGDWVEAQKLLSSDWPGGGSFGFSIDIEGDVAIIGAPRADGLEVNCGAVYVFRDHGGGTWTESQKIVAADGANGDRFGYSVALSGDTIIIGAMWDGDRGEKSGSAYIFRDDGNGSYIEVDKFTGSGVSTDHWFGRTVDISGDTAIVGASLEDWVSMGSAYVFRESGNGSWEEVVRLRASDRHAGQYFGHSVGILGRTAVVGAPEDTDNGSGAGAAYVFRNDGAGNWNEVDKLTTSDGGDGHQFGAVRRAIAFIDEKTVIIGAHGADGAEAHTGAAYVFHDDGAGDWIEIDKLFSQLSTRNDEFGKVVSVDGDVTVIGSDYDDVYGTWTGSAYVFELNCGGPSLRVIGQCPGRMGFAVEGAEANADVAFLYARGEGSFEIPPGNPCAGSVLGLNRTVQLADVIRADENGLAVLEADVPSAACDRLFVQALDLPTCVTTIVVPVR